MLRNAQYSDKFYVKSDIALLFQNALIVSKLEGQCGRGLI